MAVLACAELRLTVFPQVFAFTPANRHWLLTLGVVEESISKDNFLQFYCSQMKTLAESENILVKENLSLVKPYWAIHDVDGDLVYQGLERFGQSNNNKVTLPLIILLTLPLPSFTLVPCSASPIVLEMKEGWLFIYPSTAFLLPLLFLALPLLLC